MENAVDALKMAAAVLMFLIALSVAIISFGQVRATSDTILDINDIETEYINGDFYYKSAGTETERTVGLDTIVSTIYRVYFENYRIVFEGKGFESTDNPVYTHLVGTGNSKRYILDLEYETNVLTGEADIQKKVRTLLNAIVYGDKSPQYIVLYTGKIELPSKSLYQRLDEILRNGSKIKEYFGIYYQNDNPNVPETNKITKRVITYRVVDE